MGEMLPVYGLFAGDTRSAVARAGQSEPCARLLRGGRFRLRRRQKARRPL